MVERSIKFSDLSNFYNYELLNLSSYWGYPPQKIWTSEVISSIIDYINPLAKILPQYLNETQVGTKKICVLDIETTNYLPKAYEGFINIVGLAKISILENSFESLEIYQLFNMTRKRPLVPTLLKRAFEKLLDVDILIVFNQEFDLSIINTVNSVDKLELSFPIKIVDIHKYFPSLKAVENELEHLLGIKRLLTTKNGYNHYYRKFKGEKSPDGKRLLEPIGNYNISDTLSPLLIFFIKNQKYFLQ